MLRSIARASSHRDARESAESAALYVMTDGRRPYERCGRGHAQIAPQWIAPRSQSDRISRVIEQPKSKVALASARRAADEHVERPELGRAAVAPQLLEQLDPALRGTAHQ